jgi:hypothetical protein
MLRDRLRRFVMLSVLGALQSPDFAAAGPACDRDCLVEMASQYAAALVEHAPAHLPTAADVKFTENLVPLPFGKQGIWQTVTGRRDFNILAADPDAGNVVWIGIVKENDVPVMMTVRL